MYWGNLALLVLLYGGKMVAETTGEVEGVGRLQQGREFGSWLSPGCWCLL